MQGTVTNISEMKKFGFIRTTEGDLFFHFTDMFDREAFGPALVQQRVEFQKQQSDRGPRAINIKVLGA
jgi:cold shock CspA family protein